MCVKKFLDIGQDGRNWYRDASLLLKSRFGQKSDYAADLLAATSIMTSIKSNETLFWKAWTILGNDLPIEGFLPAMRMQLEYIKSGKPINGRKIRNFADALKGNLDAVVVDRWMMRAFDRTTEKNQDRPSTKDYDFIEQEIVGLSKEVGETTSDIQAMIWVGIRKVENARMSQSRYGSILQYRLFD